MSPSGREKNTLLPGTLDLLVLRTLQTGSKHGFGIVHAILEGSNEILLVDHGSLYPALERLEDRRLIKGKWGVSENNRRARYYELTEKGQKHLVAEAERWRRMTLAMSLILGPDLS